MARGIRCATATNDPSMPSSHHLLNIGPLALHSGRVLPDVQLAYATYGQLSARGDNAILVTHGYTASHALLAHGSGVAEGSWAPLIGPRRPLDPERFFIVCPNMLGSCYGSTGPASIDPATGRLYGGQFPDITFGDIVASQYALLQRLGVTHLRAVVGPSMGGFQALQWAVDHPRFVDVAAAIVSSTHLPPHDSMQLPALRALIERDPQWNNGAYAPGALHAALQRLRVDTLTTYGMREVLAAQGLAPAEVQARIERMAAAWAREFDPYSLIVLLRAALAFDVRPRLGAIEADTRIAVARSDALFPPDDAVRTHLAATRGASRYLVMDTPFGHAASGPAHTLWGGEFARLLGPAA